MQKRDVQLRVIHATVVVLAIDTTQVRIIKVINKDLMEKRESVTFAIY